MDMDNGIGGNNQLQGEASRILENTVCLSLELRKLGVRKKVNSGQVNKTDASDDALHVSKEILQSEYLERIGSLDNEIRKWVSSRTVPSPFRSGVYLISLDALTTVDQQLQAYSAQRSNLVECFLDEYHDKAREAQRRLGSLWDESDYPSRERVAQTFVMKTSFLELSTPGRIRQVSPELYERACRQAQEEIASAAREIREALTSEFRDLLAHACERLERKPDGSAKVFRDTLIGNIDEYLDTFSFRNVGGFEDLRAVVEQVRRTVKGNNVDAQALRESIPLADHVRASFAQAREALDAMMIARPRRVIDFTE